MKLVTGEDDAVSRWVAAQIPHMHGNLFGSCVTFGVTDQDGRILGGVVFHNYHPAYRSIEWSAAARTANWLSPSVIATIMAYPFVQLSVARVQAVIPRKSKRTRDFHYRFGFKQEGLVRRGFGNDDAVIYGLLHNDWRKSAFNPANVRATEMEAA